MRHFVKLLLALMLLGALIDPARACGWLYRSLLDGNIVEASSLSEIPEAHFDLRSPGAREVLDQKLHEARDLYNKSHAVNDYNDFGALLMYSGQYERAQKVFQEIESRQPGLYATAANLGTVNELLGQNEEAYRWIKRAIEINPDSHHGSEWIHLAILKSKLQAKGDADYFRTHSILGLDFGSTKIPVKNTNRDLHQTKKEIYYQLSERMSFIPPQDPIIAQILFDVGNISAIIDDVQTAIDIYAQAREYGYSNELMDRREKYFQQLQAKAEQQQKTDRSRQLYSGIAILVEILLGIIAFIVGVIVWVRKIIKRKRQSQ